MKNIMKIKIFKYPIIVLAMIATVLSCSDDYLEVTPFGQPLTVNYYQDQEEAFNGLVAIYDKMNKNSGGFENIVALMNSGSDDHLAGGGDSGDGAQLQVFSNYTLDGSSMAGSFWNDHYQGIFRANVLLEKLPDIDMDEDLKARYTAEAKSLRAYYYFILVRMFKNIPLITAPLGIDIYNVTQASPEDVYALIEQDLTEAKQSLPDILDPSEYGRFSKGAAQALLGKVYLYQNKMSQAATELAEVNGTPGGTSKYGYKLMDNFDDLWTLDHKFNSESILEISHTNAAQFGDWGNVGGGSFEGNFLNVMVGPRGYSYKADPAPEIPEQWGFNIITEDLYNVLKVDPRFEATILDMKALEEAGAATYQHSYQNTGYFLNKFLSTKDDLTELAGDTRLNYRQNTYAIRLADTYLMEAEALGGNGARAQALLDAVRARVGLGSIPVSLDAIMKERRLELAGEGHRWFDLVRTGQAAAKLADRGFVAGKHDIFPIPEGELNNTQLVQNPNY
jgi:hypothetical protein